jgi:hypothetical protein
MKLFPQRMLGLGLAEVGQRHVGTAQPLLRVRDDESGAGGAAWDVEASVSCAGHCNITQPSSRITSTSSARSRANPGRLLDWPHPGGCIVISRSPRRPVVPGGPALRTSLPVPLGRGVGDQCLRRRRRRFFLLRPRDCSRNARRLARRRRARCWLRRPLRTPPFLRGCSRLERLCRREGRAVGVTLSTRNQKVKRPPLEVKGARGEMLATSNWRIPASSSSRAGGTSVAPAGASVVPAGTSTDGPAASASAPTAGTNPRPLPRPVATEVGYSTYRG